MLTLAFVCVGACWHVCAQCACIYACAQDVCKDICVCVQAHMHVNAHVHAFVQCMHAPMHNVHLCTWCIQTSHTRAHVHVHIIYIYILYIYGARARPRCANHWNAPRGLHKLAPPRYKCIQGRASDADIHTRLRCDDHWNAARGLHKHALPNTHALMHMHIYGSIVIAKVILNTALRCSEATRPPALRPLA